MRALRECVEEVEEQGYCAAAEVVVEGLVKALQYVVAASSRHERFHHCRCWWA